MKKTSGRRWHFKKKEYQVRPEAERQGLIFGEPSDIKKILLARKKKPLSLKERQAFRELQATGLMQGAEEDRPEGIPEGGFLIDEREYDYGLGRKPGWKKRTGKGRGKK